MCFTNPQKGIFTNPSDTEVQSSCLCARQQVAEECLTTGLRSQLGHSAVSFQESECN